MKKKWRSDIPQAFDSYTNHRDSSTSHYDSPTNDMIVSPRSRAPTREGKGTGHINIDKAKPCAAGSLLPSASADGLKNKRQSRFRCGLQPLF